MQFPRYISSDGTLILGENYTGLPYPNEWAPVRLENGVVVPATMGETVTLSGGRSATLQPNGIWKAAGESMDESATYVVTVVSEDKKTFVGYTGYKDAFGWHRRVAKAWTAAGEKILPSLPEPWTWSTEAHSISADGKIIGGTAYYRQGQHDEFQAFQTAFLWTEENNSIKELRDVIIDKIPMWDFSNVIDTAVDISNDGNVIVGWGLEGFIFKFSDASDEIIVNSTTDRGRKADATGCETGELIANGDPECTLRSAIEAVNAGVGNEIKFAIPGQTIPTITLTKALPAITNQVKIDGTTQTAGKVEISGGGSSADCLVINGGGSTIKGLVINGFSGGDTAAAIRISGAGTNVVVGNWIGTDPSGNSPLPNVNGVVIVDSPGNKIGGVGVSDGNIIHARTASVVVLGTPSSGTSIARNRMGLSADGVAFEYIEFGVFANGGNTLTIGGENSGNTIAAKFGIYVSGNSAISTLLISDNLIGLDGTGKTGKSADRNGGIVVYSKSGAVYSGVTLSKNKVAGYQRAVLLAGNGVSNAQIRDNEIGLAFDGSGNLPAGVTPSGLASGLRLDGVPGAMVSGNKIAGHFWNVLVSGGIQFTDNASGISFKDPNEPLEADHSSGLASGAMIENNEIGLYNNSKPQNAIQGAGIVAYGKASGVTIRGNKVAGNIYTDVELRDGEGHVVTGNQIGTVNGTDYASKVGVKVTNAKLVNIGTSGESPGNIIGKCSDSGIFVEGEARNVKIEGNFIGVDALGVLEMPNVFGVKVFNCK